MSGERKWRVTVEKIGPKLYRAMLYSPTGAPCLWEEAENAAEAKLQVMSACLPLVKGLEKLAPSTKPKRKKGR